MTIADTRSRWLALIVLCLGDLMIVLDVTIVAGVLRSASSAHSRCSVASVLF